MDSVVLSSAAGSALALELFGTKTQSERVLLDISEHIAKDISEHLANLK